MYDIAIIGAGPAGATLARLLDRKFSVVVIDNKTFSGEGFHKPCGGLLALDAQKAISRLNLTLPKDVLVDPQIFAVRTYDKRTGMIRHYQRFYINLDRNKFDRWLISLIPKNVDLYQDSQCTRIEKRDGNYFLELSVHGERKNISAKYLVGADGANSIVRRYLYPKKKIRNYVSIQKWFKEEHQNPFYSCVFDPLITDSYSWTVSKDGYFIFGGAFPKKGCRKRFERQLKYLKEMGISYSEPVKTESCLVLRPSKWGDFCTGKDNVFLIGEAGAFISPSSLEGISSAINTAYDLSLVLNSGKPNPSKLYRQKTFNLRMKLFLKALKSPFMYYPPLRQLVMISGMKSINVIDSKAE